MTSLGKNGNISMKTERRVQLCFVADMELHAFRFAGGYSIRNTEEWLQDNGNADVLHGASRC